MDARTDAKLMQQLYPLLHPFRYLIHEDCNATYVDPGRKVVVAISDNSNVTCRSETASSGLRNM